MFPIILKSQRKRLVEFIDIQNISPNMTQYFEHKKRLELQYNIGEVQRWFRVKSRTSLIKMYTLKKGFPTYNFDNH